jgi:hypothetical protein
MNAMEKNKIKMLVGTYSIKNYFMHINKQYKLYSQ